MLESRWLRNIALGIALVLATPVLGQEGVQPQGPSKREAETANASDNGEPQSAQEHPGISTSLAADEDAAQEAEGNSEAKPQYNPHEPMWDWRPYVVITPGDTLAQWGMAIFGVIATILSGIAVFLLWKTLQITRAAVREAENATRTAHDAVSVTRDTARQQMRAYIGIKKAWMQWLGQELWAIVAFENMGQTPAYNGTNWMTACKDPAHFPRTPPPYESRFTLGPRAPMEIHVCVPNVQPKDTENMTGANPRIFVWGEIEYTDVFGSRWRTSYRLMGTGKVEGKNIFTLGACAEGNEAT